MVEPLELFASMSKIVGSDGFLIEQQASLIRKSLKSLSSNPPKTLLFKDLSDKISYAKSKFIIAEKSFLKKRERLLVELGEQNVAKVAKQSIEGLLPSEREKVEVRRKLMNFLLNQGYSEARREQRDVDFEEAREVSLGVAGKMTDLLNQQHVLWQELMVDMEKMHFGDKDLQGGPHLEN